MKLYTKTGDAGETGLFGGMRVSKAALRVEAYGEVDELNATLGLLAAALSDASHAEIRTAVVEIQSRLFDLGADLATPPDSPGREHIVPVPESAVERLEGWIDAAEARLAPLTAFILPGGTEVSARLHLARTVCRRAERAVVRLRDALSDGTTSGSASAKPTASNDVETLAGPIIYLNRLSDLLFALARLANHEAGVRDVVWQSPRKSEPSENA